MTEPAALEKTMTEAIGQVMTGCPKDEIPVVAVPHNDQTEKLANAWLNDKNGRLRAMGIRIALIHWKGKVEIKT